MLIVAFLKAPSWDHWNLPPIPKTSQKFSHVILFAITSLLMTSSSINLAKISEIDDIRHHPCHCITDVRDWCASRRLQLNALQMELLWFGSRSNLCKLSSADLTLPIGDNVKEPALVARDFGVCLDAEQTMKPHISRVASSCFFQLRRLRQVRHSFCEEVIKRLVTAFVLGCVDYCNAALACLLASTVRPLQRVQDAAARLVINAKSSDHITPILERLHWLSVNQRTVYKLCLLMHLFHTNQCPDYMADMVHLTTDCT
jgi:hypothetical protein